MLQAATRALAFALVQHRAYGNANASGLINTQALHDLTRIGTRFFLTVMEKEFL